MDNTTHYNLKKPDYSDFADIQDINDNMDTIDAELANLTGNVSSSTVENVTASSASYPSIAAGDTVAVAAGKVNKSLSDLGSNKLDKTGDAADAKIGSSTASTAAYPIPAANDTFKVILGKIIKFFADIKAAYTNVSVSGKTVTFTTAAGGTKQITTQDTTYSDFTKATASAAGTHGLVPAPTSGWYNDRKLVFLSGNASWEYLPLQNNATTTAAYYALDARMGKTLNDRITSVVNRFNVTDGNGTLNTTYVNSGGVTAYKKQRCYDKYITTVTFDINFKSSYSSDNVAIIASGFPAPSIGGSIFICAGESYNGAAYYGYVLVSDTGVLKPWYCSTVKGHWFGSVTYISN